MMVLVAGSAHACPACASGQSGSRWLYLVMVLLPFVVGGLAVRAIYAALRE
ncbi:MAG: hypothetical protein ABI321_21765 [Polyangia bacterium]